MTSKLQAKIGAIVAGVTAFISWLATVPPEQQSGILAPLVDLLPLTWRPQIGLATRALATVSAIWATYKAAHSGPQTPPPNKPV